MVTRPLHLALSAAPVVDQTEQSLQIFPCVTLAPRSFWFAALTMASDGFVNGAERPHSCGARACAGAADGRGRRKTVRGMQWKVEVGVSQVGSGGSLRSPPPLRSKALSHPVAGTVQ